MHCLISMMRPVISCVYGAWLVYTCSAGDHAKAFLFAHVAPLADDTSESLSTLTFAKRASEVTLGKPTRRIINSSSERPLTHHYSKIIAETVVVAAAVS